MHKVAEKTFVDRHSSGEKGNHATSLPGIAGESLVNYEWKLRKRMHRRYAFRGKGARDISLKSERQAPQHCGKSCWRYDKFAKFVRFFMLCDDENSRKLSMIWNYSLQPYVILPSKIKAN
jgi:hypothetical protein